VNDPTYDGPPRKAENRVYQRGRTRVYVTRRSWLDAGTEVRPGERKFTDYAFPPGYSYGQQIDRLYTSRRPLGDQWDTGTPFPFVDFQRIADRNARHRPGIFMPMLHKGTGDGLRRKAGIAAGPQPREKPHFPGPDEPPAFSILCIRP
jgi:hypothetical protein